MADRTITADLIGRDRMSPAFDKAGKSAGRLHGVLGKVGGAMKTGLAAGAVAAGVGVLALGGFLAQGVRDAASYQAVTAKTAAVLRSTGNAAGTTVDAIKAHSAALESLSGVDEELIINAQNVLATFTAVRNGVGRGNNIFDQATDAALNMSVALGSDLQGATMQIGKALQNPIKGIAALTRAGVSFTAQQKKQITAMVEAGDTMGAQKLILAELNKEFGGAAKAAGAGFEGSMARAKDAMSDAGREIGTVLLPYVTKFADWVSAKGVPAAMAFAKAHGPQIKAALTGFLSGVSAVWGFLSGKLWPLIRQGYQAIMPGIRKAFGQAKAGIDDFRSSGVNFGAWLKAIGPVLKVVATVIGVVLVGAFTAVANVIRVAGWAFKNVFVPAARFAIDGVLMFLRVVAGFVGVMAKLPGPLGAPWRAAQGAVQGAIAKVEELRRAINNVPTKRAVRFTVTVNGKQSNVIQRPDGTVSIGGVEARASGGSVASGRPYVVGEQGPELFVPGGSGTIIPNGSGSASGAVTLVVNVHVTQPFASARQLAAAVQDALASTALDYGPMRRRLGIS
jgi:hypothetical protein